MKVLVNAVSIREGGPLVVLRALLGGMREQRPDIQWLLAANAGTAGPLAGDGVVPLDSLPRDGIGSLARWYEQGLPRAVSWWKPSVVFSLTNYLPFRTLSRPAVLLEQHAGHFSIEFSALNRRFHRSPRERLGWRLKNAWVRHSVRKADVLLVQTQALANEIARSGLRSRERITVVPHGPGQVSRLASCRERSFNGPFRVGYVSKFGVQKNFETLFRSVRMLADEGHDVRLLLTLNPAYEPARRVLDNAQSLGIGHLIENCGEVAGKNIEAVYDGIDALVFCSVCESFGFPMTEGMARGLPIVVADTEENREVAGSQARRFSPLDHARLADHLRVLMTDGLEYRLQSERSLARSRDFSWQFACRDTLHALESAANLSP